MWMLECIAGLVSELPLAVTVLTGHTHWRTLEQRTFMLHFDHFDLDRAVRGPF